MSEEQPKSVKLSKLPFVIKKNINKGDTENFELVFQCMKSVPQNLFREDVIYNASENDFLKGKYPNLNIVNRLNVTKNCSRTTATYTDSSYTIQLTSDGITRLIGQSKYDTVFSALCSIINQELRIEGILSLLTVDNKKSVECQTFQSCREILIRENKRKNRKQKKVTSYVVTDHLLEGRELKKVVIDPEDIIKSESIKVEVVEKGEIEDHESNLPDIQHLLNEDSNISDTSIGNISLGSFSIPDILENPKSLLNNIDKHTEENIESSTTITMLDGSVVTIKGDPDIFHLASPEVLKGLSSMDQKRILFHQAYIDWKFCLHRDEDGYLPLHWAVLNKDIDLLKRHCVVLKTRQESVDLAAHGNTTALQMAIQHDFAKSTAVLLQHGADPLIVDEESRTPLHLAAEVNSDHLLALINHCKAHAREILAEDEELWTPNLENKSDTDLANYLMAKMCSMFDNQGYTPLMIASKMAKHENVLLLLEAAPNTVNLVMPTSGNTALYLAVGAAHIDCIDRHDHSKVSPEFIQTIDHLITHGADLEIENCSGSNVNMLLNDNFSADLSLLIANKLTSINLRNTDQHRRCDEFILLKNKQGSVKVQELKTGKNKLDGIIKINESEISHIKNVREKDKNKLRNVDVTKEYIKIKPKINENPNNVIIKNKNERNKETPKLMINASTPVIISKEKPVVLQNIPVFTVANAKKPIILKKNITVNRDNKVEPRGLSFVKILPKNMPKVIYKRVAEDTEASSSKKSKS